MSVNVYLVTFSMAFNCMIRNVNENGEQCVYFGLVSTAFEKGMRFNP